MYKKNYGNSCLYKKILIKNLIENIIEIDETNYDSIYKEMKNKFKEVWNRNNKN